MAFCKGCGKELGFFSGKIKIKEDGNSLLYCKLCGNAVQNAKLKEQISKSSPISDVVDVQLILDSVGNRKINVIMIIREITSLGLKEAKIITETVPAVIGKFSTTTGELNLKKLHDAGAQSHLDKI
jgi:ribosomal protein L7/L12